MIMTITVNIIIIINQLFQVRNPLNTKVSSKKDNDKVWYY